MRGSKMEEASFFAGSSLNRLAEKRADCKFISDLLKDKRSLFFLFDGLNPFATVVKNENGICIVQLLALNVDNILECFQRRASNDGMNDKYDEKVFVERIYQDGNAIFLGERLENGLKHYYFAINLTDYGLEEIENSVTSGSGIEIKILKSRFDIMKLKKQDASLVSQSRSLIDWNQRYLFCPTCGSRTISEDAGYKRTCTDEKCLSRKGIYNTNYPRTDPVVISAVTSPDKQRILLGRKSTFPQNMFSCLAGFMEPGESIEEAVRREVKEESGITVGPVKYIASQPWPYPSVIMIGCISEAEDEEITVCAEELEDAKWFTRSDVETALDGPGRLLSIPPKQTIAHQLIEAWFQSTQG